MQKPKVAFVSSGGAAKGIAHVGVLRALEELNISPDIYVGASSGAVAGAFAAQGIKAETMIDWFRPFYDRKAPRTALKGRYFAGAPKKEEWLSLGWLASGVFSIHRFEQFLREQLPTNDFRRLEKTLLVTATDVDGRGRVVFGTNHNDEVSISDAVAASSCVPGFFRPYRIGDRYYIDGELVRTLSIDLAVQAGADVVVISNVYRPDVTSPADMSMAHRGLPAIVRQATNIILSEKEKRGIDLIHRLYPNLTILNVSPDLGQYSFLSRSNARQLLMRGYREGLRVIAPAKERGAFNEKLANKALGQA